MASSASSAKYTLASDEYVCAHINDTLFSMFFFFFGQALNASIGLVRVLRHLDRLHVARIVCVSDEQGDCRSSSVRCHM